MGLTGLDHVVIAVTEWERSNAFYRDVLGVEVVEVPYGRYVYVLPDGRRLNVHGPGSTPSPRAVDPVRPGNSDLCLETTLRARPSVAEGGAVCRPCAGGLADRASSPRTSVYFRDPDGSLLELIVYG